MNFRLTIVIAAVLGASGVALGAYQAHGLEKRLVRGEVPADQVSRRVENAAVAVRYQLIHAVALLSLAAIAAKGDSKILIAARWLLVGGVLLFSGGLYFIAFTRHVGHWAIVPSGGVLLIVAWLDVGFHALRRNPADVS